ncbi:uncharacterized protein LOC112458432 [Temnothorax curvispinosus]|uniref:Uncharacterized protein LOC112458432 n=1 Tax=Temnothorax curvispinosus TaxID=300111 RepID=A0A6J1Q6L9_9HYME|nr:uncharacterized protein LOC112458432 [Temnothorax curvispinosus]
MTHVQINSMLSVLREHKFHQQLPKDARTLLKTPTKCTDIKVLNPGHYLHIGVTKNIIMKLKNIPISDEIPRILLVDFSTDGANIYNNVRCDVWPIQFRIINITDKSPMIAGLYQGKKQPAAQNAKFVENVIRTTVPMCIKE